MTKAPKENLGKDSPVMFGEEPKCLNPKVETNNRGIDLINHVKLLEMKKKLASTKSKGVDMGKRTSKGLVSLIYNFSQ